MPHRLASSHHHPPPHVIIMIVSMIHFENSYITATTQVLAHHLQSRKPDGPSRVRSSQHPVKFPVRTPTRSAPTDSSNIHGKDYAQRVPMGSDFGPEKYFSKEQRKLISSGVMREDLIWLPFLTSKMAFRSRIIFIVIVFSSRYVRLIGNLIAFSSYNGSWSLQKYV